MLKKNGKIQIHSDVVMIAVGKLKPSSYNPNNMSAAEMSSLVHGIQTEGFIDPLHVQKESNTIIDGEHRLKAAKRLKMPKVPVIYLDVNDVQARKLTLAFIHRRGSTKGPDVALLLQEIQAIEAHTIKRLTLDTAIVQKELKEMLANVDSTEDEVAAALGKDKGKKKATKASKKGKVDVSPDEPEGDFAETEVGEDSPELYAFPVTFYAPSLEEQMLLKALCFDEEAKDFSFEKLKKLVDYYLQKHPKKAKRVLARIASDE